MKAYQDGPFRYFDDVTRSVDFLVQAVLIAIMVGLLALLNFQVLMRYVIRTPLIWGGELGGFLLAYVTLWGCSTCIRNDKHVRVRYIESALPAKLKRILSIVIHLIILFYLYYLIVYGYQFAELGIGEKTTSGAFEFFWPRFSMTSGGILMALQTVNILVRETVQLVAGEPYPPAPE